MEQVYDLFPTLVMKFSGVLLPHEVDNLFKKLKEYKTNKIDPALIRGRSSYGIGANDILSDLGLKKKMQEKINVYIKRLKLKPLKICNSWFSIQDVGGMLKDHSHGSSIVSGAFYVNIDEGSSPLVFENPNHLVVFNYEDVYEQSTSYTSTYFNFYPQKGDLIIFPSWLKHGCNYKPNQTMDRTLISFNTQVK